jgi:transformation/transcription domain-associated protein
MREIMESWRLRQPNDWEAPLHWQDLLLWRNQIHNIVINAFSNAEYVGPSLHQLGYKEKAWSVNRLAAIMTLHGCTDSSLTVLNTMYGYSAMEMQEAFVKIREQAKAYLDRPAELQAGINILATSNLDYFQPHHQSEVFRLKGLFQQALDDSLEAHTSFSTALCLWKQVGRVAACSRGRHCLVL